MPKLAFIGWKFSLVVDIYLLNAPIIVKSEKTISLFVWLYCSIAFNADTNPEEIDSTYPSTPVICPAKYIFLLLFNWYVGSSNF